MDVVTTGGSISYPYTKVGVRKLGEFDFSKEYEKFGWYVCTYLALRADSLVIAARIKPEREGIAMQYNRWRGIEFSKEIAVKKVWAQERSTRDSPELKSKAILLCACDLVKLTQGLVCASMKTWDGWLRSLWSESRETLAASESRHSAFSIFDSCRVRGLVSTNSVFFHTRASNSEASGDIRNSFKGRER